jgi:DNA-binding NarL/FixJ family response regulator
MSVKILVADDFQGIRAAVSQLIQDSHEDWKVCCEAADGQAAVDRAVEAKPDLAILDMRMPLRDGLSAGREIRALLPGVRILIFTMIESPYLEAVAASAGFQGVVPKSRCGTLITAIRKALALKDPPSNGCH